MKGWCPWKHQHLLLQGQQSLQILPIDILNQSKVTLVQFYMRTSLHVCDFLVRWWSLELSHSTIVIPSILKLKLTITKQDTIRSFPSHLEVVETSIRWPLTFLFTAARVGENGLLHHSKASKPKKSRRSRYLTHCKMMSSKNLWLKRIDDEDRSKKVELVKFEKIQN